MEANEAMNDLASFLLDDMRERLKKARENEHSANETNEVIIDLKNGYSVEVREGKLSVTDEKLGVKVTGGLPSSEQKLKREMDILEKRVEALEKSMDFLYELHNTIPTKPKKQERIF